MNDVYWLIPSTIDLAGKLKANPPSFGWKKIDFFYHIIDHILQLTEYEDLDNNAAFVNVSSRYLQEFNKHYKQYLDYLIEQKIIVSDRYYIPGAKSTGYKLAPSLAYGAEIINISVIDFKCRQKRRKELAEVGKKVQLDYPALTKWFNPLLRIDVTGALDRIDEMFPKKTSGIRGELRYNRKYLRQPDDASKRLKAIGAVRRFANKEFYYSIDDNVKRFHSNLTNIKRELRHYITYNNQKLVNIDIKSAQPFLSQLLLMPEFYKNQGEHVSINDFPAIKQPLTTSTIKSGTISYYMMLVKAVQNIDKQEVILYSDCIKSGAFYERLYQILYPKGTSFNKQKFKVEVYRLLFSKNRSQSDFKKKFKSHFPHIYKIFSIYKRADHSLLARLLQTIESQIMIQRVANRIAEERPDLPIFSIHDSIATTTGNEGYASAVVIDEAEKLIGLKPQVGIECWG